jgi:hypothetical protein
MTHLLAYIAGFASALAITWVWLKMQLGDL